MKGTKANMRSRIMHGGSEARTHEASFMRTPVAERHRGFENPLEGDTDPRGLPYYIATGGPVLPCYMKPSLGKKER